MIPFFDMKARHASRRQEFLDAIADVIDAGDYSGGSAVSEFECDFADYCGTTHAISVGNGTEALWLTLLAMGIGPGDEVITVPMTFIATVEAILTVGATPVFVDIDELTYTMAPAALSGALSARTKAIVPVHLFGQMAEMEAIVAFARKHGLRVIEDAAQAHGARYGNRMAGAYGDAGCFSFYPSKNLGAFGEGGAIVTENPDLADNLRILRNHGQSRKNYHSVLGWNSRLDSIQAAVLRIKLRSLDQENQLRRNHAGVYNDGLESLLGIVTPHCTAEMRHVYHLYVIRAQARDMLKNSLVNRGIGCGVHYPVPVHLQPACAHLGFKKGDFPVSELCAKEFLSLPIYPDLTSQQIECVIRSVQQAVTACTAA